MAAAEDVTDFRKRQQEVQTSVRQALRIMSFNFQVVFEVRLDGVVDC